MSEVHDEDSVVSATGPQEISDDALEQVTGGSGVPDLNKTMLVYASTYIPFDSDF